MNTYSDTVLGYSGVYDVFYRIGDQLSNIKYQEHPLTFSHYLDNFTEMVGTYKFPPTASPPVGANSESECFNAEEISVLSCLPPDASFDPQAGRAISVFLNTQPCIACIG